mgnify:CR=1 FL=1
MKIIRYHIYTSTPINPPVCVAVHFAQPIGGGGYKQCVDAHPSQVRRLTDWLTANTCVSRYKIETSLPNTSGQGRT